MFSISDFLDRAKRGAGVESDYALAKIAGLTKNAISNYRTERTAPDERAIVLLCRYSGDDPEHVAACVQSMRAANDDAAHLWRRVADRLKGPSVKALLPLIAIGAAFAALPDPAQAAALSNSHSLYIMLNALLLWRLARRLAKVQISQPRTIRFA